MDSERLPEPAKGNSKVQGQFRNICATAWCHHYTREELDAKLQERCKYYVYSIEKCPTTGTLHYQMYMELKNRTSKDVCFKWLPMVKMGARRGTQTEAIDYCIKGDTHVEGPWEWGEKNTQGVEGGLRLATQMLAGGSRLRDVALEHPDAFVRYARGLTEYSTILNDRSREKPEVIYVYGPPGSGKTRYAVETFGDDYDNVQYNGDRFVGYHGNDNVILDDFDGGIPRQLVLNMLDRIRLTVRTVGSTMRWMPKRIIITSNFLPDSYTKYAPVSAFIRRLDRILYKHDLSSEFEDRTHYFK